MYAVDMLGVLGLPEDLIADVRSMLTERAGELEETKPTEIGNVFGGSDQGAQLGHHASLARQRVADAVTEMAEGLRGFGTELASHVDRMNDTDTSNAADLTRIESYADSVGATTFHSDGPHAIANPSGGGA